MQRLLFRQRGAAVQSYGVGSVSNKDRDYYLARIAAEREAAERAADEHVRRVHLQLADQYEQRLNGGSGEEPLERS